MYKRQRSSRHKSAEKEQNEGDQLGSHPESEI
jgi:hypothetical protein